MGMKRQIRRELALVGNDRAVAKLDRYGAQVDERANKLMVQDEARFAVHQHRTALTVNAAAFDGAALIGLHQKFVRDVNGSAAAAALVAEIEDIVFRAVADDLRDTLDG